MVITGDDILIEYVSRIIAILENILTVCLERYQDQASKITCADDIIPQ